MRYFLGLVEVAGFFESLKQGICANGRQADFYCLQPHPFAYRQEGGWFNRCFFQIDRLCGYGRLPQWLALMLRIPLLVSLLVQALVRYDVFVFSGFGSFFGFLELPILKLFHKKIVVIYLGSDARDPVKSGVYRDDHEHGEFDPSNTTRRSRRLLRRIRRVERWSDLIINHTATADFFRRPFIPLLSIGLPVNVKCIQALASGPRSHTLPTEIRVVHAPSRPLAKGSHEFRRAIEQVNKRLSVTGKQIKLVELVNRSNTEVLRALADCDFALNEMYSDTFMSIFDTEAAALAKPSLTFGYYTDTLKSENPKALFPEIYCYFTPEKLEEKLFQFSQDTNLRLTAGKAAQYFVTEQWSCEKVGQRFVEAVEMPDYSELCHPATLTHSASWGLPQCLLQQNMDSYEAWLSSR
jgi:hypothetical protein